MHVPLRFFLRVHAGSSREAFLAQVLTPHLLLRQRLQPPLPDERRGTRVVQLGDGDEGGPQNPLLFPVAKAAGANLFANMITVGRAPNNDVVLADSRVSRLQCFLRSDRGWWMLGDTCSTNGTRVDGKDVPRDALVRLTPGVKLLLAGQIELEFLDPEALHRLLRDESLRVLTARPDGGLVREGERR